MLDHNLTRRALAVVSDFDIKGLQPAFEDAVRAHLEQDLYSLDDLSHIALASNILDTETLTQLKNKITEKLAAANEPCTFETKKRLAIVYDFVTITEEDLKADFTQSWSNDDWVSLSEVVASKLPETF